MERIHFLAAEIFSYSYANYDDHLGINERFDTLMPRDAELLETALKEEWPIEKVAQELDVSDKIARKLLFAVKEALEKGLPETLTAETANGYHYYYRRPEGVPARRVTNYGNSGKIDILSKGFAVAPPSLHRTGAAAPWAMPWARPASRPVLRGPVVEAAYNQRARAAELRRCGLSFVGLELDLKSVADAQINVTRRSSL